MNKPMRIATSPIYRAVKPVRDPERRRFVKRFPCIGCGRTWGIDPMHTGPHGLSQKACDFSTLPGCRKCHQQFDQDPRGFARERQIDIAAQVRNMNALYAAARHKEGSLSERSVLAEFMRGAERRRGEEIPEGMPNCMYWMKHHEAALAIASLIHGSNRPDLGRRIQGIYRRLAVILAEQWNAYERIETGTGINRSPDSQPAPKEQA